MSETPSSVHVKNYITAQGAEKLKEELHRLLHVDRPELVRVIAWAASNGDRSENGDYIYGKRRLREIDRRIRFLTKRLEQAEVVDPSSQQKDRVRFGASVTIRDEDERERIIRIVGQDEINPSLGWVSWVSPMAKALLDARVGDVVELRSPQGNTDLEIIKIQY